MTVVKEGSITWPPPADVTATAAAPKAGMGAELEEVAEKKPSVLSKRVLDLATVGELLMVLFGIGFFVIVAFLADITFVSQLLYFILSGILVAYTAPLAHHEKIIQSCKSGGKNNSGDSHSAA